MIGKINEGKLNYELNWEFIELLAQRMKKGKEKYQPYSWKSPIPIEDMKQALFRHTIEIMKGNLDDEGQKYGHLAAVAINSMILHYQYENSEKEFKESCLKDLTNSIPNDQKLGEIVREMVKEKF